MLMALATPTRAAGSRQRPEVFTSLVQLYIHIVPNLHASREFRNNEASDMASTASAADYDEPTGQSVDGRLAHWAETLARPPGAAALRSAAPGPDCQSGPSPAGAGHRTAKAAIGTGVLAAGLGLGLTILLHQARPDLLQDGDIALVMASVLAAVIVLLLALTLSRLLAVDHHLRRHAAAPVPDLGSFALSLGTVAEQMDHIARHSAMLEARFTAAADALDWASRKNLATLQSVTGEIETERIKLDEAAASAEVTLRRVLETAQLLCGVVRTAGDTVWTVANENGFTLDARTRDMAERLRCDLRAVVEESLDDFETRAREAVRRAGSG